MQAGGKMQSVKCPCDAQTSRGVALKCDLEMRNNYDASVPGIQLDIRRASQPGTFPSQSYCGVIL